MVFAFAFANAQSFSVGARAGLNIANQSFSYSGLSLSPDSKVGVIVGGYFKFMFTDNIGLQPELFYNSGGSSLSIQGSSSDFSLSYISIPVFFRYNVNETIHFLAGPQLGILTSASQPSGGQSQDIKSDLKSTDFGGTFGVGADFGPFNAGLRYNFSLSNIGNDSGNFSGGTVKNTAFQIVAGYRLFGN